jgi:hypothetical protein
LLGNTFVERAPEFGKFAKHIACFANSHPSQSNFNLNNFEWRSSSTTTTQRPLALEESLLSAAEERPERIL